MKVLMAASEAQPYAKTGGLADMVTALSKHLVSMDVQTRVLIPLYGQIDTKDITPLNKKISVDFPVEEDYFQLFEHKAGALTFHFIDHPLFSQRKGIYSDKEGEFSDNPIRFGFFAAAVWAYCKEYWEPDIIHCHDWMGGLIPFYKKYHHLSTSIKILCSIHNIGYQGVYDLHYLKNLNIPEEDAYYYKLIKDGQLNFLNCALYNSNYLSTVSPTYAEEILRPEFNFGLGNTIRRRNHLLEGIINGMDTEVWNPETDPLLPYNYSPENIENKELLKNECKLQWGLSKAKDSPLFAIIGRLVHQKGFGALLDRNKGSLKRFLQENPKAQFVILATGFPPWEEELRFLESQFTNLKVFLQFDEKLAHLIEGAADFFFMPSSYEPCGLNQMYSMIYGTIPICRNTGGLADTVLDLTQDKESGTGFLFEKDSPQGQLEALRLALHYWESEIDVLKKARIRGMKQDFTWKKSAEKYKCLYTKIRKR